MSQFTYMISLSNFFGIAVFLLPNLVTGLNTKFGTNISDKKLLNTTKCQVTAFTISELLRENQQGKITPSQIRVKTN